MNQEIYEKLREMRLPIMAEEYKDQSENTDTQNMTFGTMSRFKTT